MNQAVPAMAVPAVCTPNLARLLAWYRELGFRVSQEVRGVLAFIEQGPVRLQLWQRAGQLQRECFIRIDGRGASVFDIHAALAQRDRRALGEGAPRLRAWGAWEFSLTDIEGNRLVFVQWAAGSAIAPRPQ